MGTKETIRKEKEMETNWEKLREAAILVLDWMLDNPDEIKTINHGAMQDGLNSIIRTTQDEENGAF